MMKTWLKTETTEGRVYYVKKKDKEENWRIGKENAGLEMEERREEEWKAATREKEENVTDFWGNHHNGVIGIWRGREEWGRRKRFEKGGNGRNSGKRRANWMINLNEAKLMNEENWIWNNINEEEFGETDAGDNRRGMKIRNAREKEEKERG